MGSISETLRCALGSLQKVRENETKGLKAIILLRTGGLMKYEKVKSIKR